MFAIALAALALLPAGGPPCQTIRIYDEGPFLSGTREAYVCWGPGSSPRSSPGRIRFQKPGELIEDLIG
jgi:hypothetical protein